MRPLLGALILAAATLLHATPASASCAPPASVAENAARAVAVVYGTVTATETGALTMRVDRALKGQIVGSPRIFVGPGRGGTRGTAMATSVDYPGLGGPARVGSDHVLYLIRGADGALETNACIGSHAGPPDPSELSFFGTLRSPDVVATPAPANMPELAPPSAAVSPIWLVAAVATAGVALIVIRRRRVA